MFTCEKPWIFVEHIQRQGVNKDTGAVYDYKRLKVSDGIEAFTVPYVDSLQVPPLIRGDLVQIKIDLDGTYKNIGVKISSIKKN